MSFPLIASHRGGAQLWIENTRTAFENTAQLPVDFVEFDVQRSRDGVPVVFHDATLDRVTEAAGPLVDRTAAELRRVRYRGTDDTILTLDEVLALFAHTPLGLRVEIKPGPGLVPYPGLEAQIMRALDDAGLLHRAQVTSFLRPNLIAAAACGTPGQGLLWLLADAVVAMVGDDDALHALALEVGITRMAMRIGLLTAARVDAARRAGIALSSYATHSEAEIEQAVSCRVEIFTTDRPDLAVSVRDRVGRKPSAT